MMSHRLLASLLGLAVMAYAQGLKSCGGAQYYPTEYTCYNGSTLCPVLFSLPTLPCGGACYAPDMYACVNSKLTLLPQATDPFIMVAFGDNPAVKGKMVTACGGYLTIGSPSTCTWCSSAVSGCGDYQNNTVLLPDGEMAAGVPGGQYWFVDPTDGSIQYTAGGKANSMPDMTIAGQGVVVYDDGFFAYQGPNQYWFACPTDDAGNIFHIFAPTAANMQRTDCVQVKLTTCGTTDRMQGAYEYA